MYFTAIEKQWPDIADEWARRCHVQKDVQYGGTFDGNSCRLLLRNCDLLDSIINDLASKRYVTAFKMLDKVVHSCFGNVLESDYKESVLSFKLAYLDLGISVTPKVHAIFYHIVEFCELGLDDLVSKHQNLSTIASTLSGDDIRSTVKFQTTVHVF